MPFPRKTFSLSGTNPNTFSSPMPKSQSINSICQNNSFVIPCIQRNLCHIFCEQMVPPAAEKTLFSYLTFSRNQTFLEIFMPQTFLDHAFFYSFCFLFFPDFFIHLRQRSCEEGIQLRQIQS